MFPYLTSYRYYTLAKAGFVAAYLWFISDFFRIHLAFWDKLSQLLPDASVLSYSGIPSLDVGLRALATALNTKAAVWILLLISPIVSALFLWGRHRWLQAFVGAWMCFSMIAMTSIIGVFDSTADVWLNYVFIAYALTALVCPTVEWERREPGFEVEKWQSDPVLLSTYARLIVIVQFTVYFYAGVNKLVFGWHPWTTGTALQNLAIDSSMRDYLRGMTVPYWISLILCYVTLFQRLVVPFGFFFMRYRLWSALILGSMHVGYFILMKVAIFPVIGIASLLMVAPPPMLAPALFSRKPIHLPKQLKKLLEKERRGTVLQKTALCAFSIWLLFESARMTSNEAMPWENKLMVVPAWRMFADGGVFAGGQWLLILQTPKGEVDATELSVQPLPHLWRDRFYLDLILHMLINASDQGGRERPDPLVQRLFDVTEKAYAEKQNLAHADPVVYQARFALYQHRNQQ
jgi:hypothetical protein